MLVLLASAPDERTVALADRYVDAVRLRVTARLVALEDAESMGHFGLAPTQDRQGIAVQRVIAAIRDDLSGRGDRLDGVVLLGDDTVFPFWRFGNPVPSRVLDPDPVVLSD